MKTEGHPFKRRVSERFCALQKKKNKACSLVLILIIDFGPKNANTA